MKVEMLVRRVVDGRVQFSVELVATYNGDSECVTLTNPLGRLTALAVASRSKRCTSLSTTVVPTDAEDDTSLRMKELR
jgi:hypothetical protein